MTPGHSTQCGVCFGSVSLMNTPLKCGIRQRFLWKFETEHTHDHGVRLTDCDTIGAGCFIKKLHRCTHLIYIYNLQLYIYNLRYNLQFTI